jgi:hypothetical protein
MAYGTINADVIGTSIAGTNLGPGNSSTMKNRIINGAMVIDQRNAGASVTPVTGTQYYGVDRFGFNISQSSKFSSQQNAGSITPPSGFSNYLGITSLSAYSIVSTDYFQLLHRVEGYNVADLGWGTANAKTVTINFLIYSSLTGTFAASVRNAPTYDRSYVFNYTVNTANTWEQKTITIVGDTTGTWGKTSGAGLELVLSLGAGSTFNGTAGSWASGSAFSTSGAVNIVANNSATFYITGVQLEVGTNATGFEYRQYGTELALCQRYYCYRVNDITLNSTYGTASYPFKVSMRAAPTVTMTIGTTAAITTEGFYSTAAGNSQTTWTASAEL